MISWVKWAWGHRYFYKSRLGYFKAKQMLSFPFFLLLSMDFFFWAHFLLNQDYTWERERFLLMEIDLQESRCQLTSIPVNCCHWMGFSHLLYPHCSHWICQNFWRLVILHTRLGHFSGLVDEFRVLAAASNSLENCYTSCFRD